MPKFLSRLAVAIALWAVSSLAQAEIMITDIKGREVHLTKPAERVVLGFYYEDFIAVVGPGAVDKIVALSLTPWKDWRPLQYAAYLKAFPKLADLPDVGDTETGNFSIEKAIAAKPDLVILPAWSYDALGERAKQFDAAGIPVIVIDYNAQTVEKHAKSTLALGKAMGREDRAEQLVADYKKEIDAIVERVKKSEPTNKKVYVELAQKGPDEVGSSYPTSVWGGVIEILGGVNIAKGQVSDMKALDSKYVLAQKPDIILLAGSEWIDQPKAVVVGFGVNDAMVNERIAAYLKRPGWSELPAVKNGDVYAIYQGGARTLSDFAYIQFIAKILHPNAFKDIEPQAEITKYYKKWLPVVPDGVFFQKYRN